MNAHRIINTITAGPAVLAAGTIRFYVVQGPHGALRMFDEHVDGTVYQSQGTVIETPACVLDAVKANRAGGKPAWKAEMTRAEMHASGGNPDCEVNRGPCGGRWIWRRDRFSYAGR